MVQFEVTEYTVSEGGGGIIFAVVVTVTPAPDEPIEVIANIIGDTPEGKYIQCHVVSICSVECMVLVYS